jgi:hypothetical protein|tara:strand:- start:214 stop:576 length:363 start_codon:yes stop_codon:yes gene_type:complete
MEVIFSGTQSYHKGGKCNGYGEFTFRFKTPDGENSLNFLTKTAGTWSLHGNEIVETIEDGVVTPLNESAKSFLNKSPEFAALFQPIRGETTTSIILAISNTSMVLQLSEPKITLTLNKRL